MEIFVALLITIITVIFAIQLGMSRPVALPLLMGFIPTTELINNKDILFVGVGILGATVSVFKIIIFAVVY